MSAPTDQDIVAAFLSSMESEGVIPSRSIAQDLMSGKLFRFECVGDRPGRENGFAALNLGRNPNGVFGNWRTGVRVKWYAANQSEIFRERHPNQSHTYNSNKIALQQIVAEKAASLWKSCRPADPSHPYLVRKGIQSDCIGQHRECLVVPMADIDQNIWNLQFIKPDGGKRFLKGGRVSGLFWTRSGTSQLCALIGEGVATMAAIADATHNTVVAAFSASNLLPVATVIAERYPATELILCADNDAHLPKNVGLDAAKEAAAAVGAWLAVAERAACDD